MACTALVYFAALLFEVREGNTSTPSPINPAAPIQSHPSAIPIHPHHPLPIPNSQFPAIAHSHIPNPTKGLLHDELTVFAGEQLSYLTDGVIPAPLHRVPPPTTNSGILSNPPYPMPTHLPPPNPQHSFPPRQTPSSQTQSNPPDYFQPSAAVSL